MLRPDHFDDFQKCKLGRFEIVESSEIERPFIRAVPSAKGDQQINVTHGLSLHIAYEQTPFVNFKAERLGNYADDKKALIESIKYLGSQTDMEPGEPKLSSMNGLEVYGINRKHLAGGVLSVYILLRDEDLTAVTLYILNTPPESPKFRTMEQYRALRDEFLKNFAACAGSAARTSGP
ncbi:MAG TPA: hypothetical protein VLA83_14270 [Candidatus Binatia bacterium]|nr:hypothetical protein [Candidatus Binatia bacterium]